MSNGDGQGGDSALARRRLRLAVAAWAVTGLVGGVLVSTLHLQGAAAVSGLTTLAGFATGAVIGMTGLAAVAAGLLAYAVAVQLVVILGAGESGAFIATLLGTSAALGAAVWMAFGAGVRYLVRSRASAAGAPAVEAGPAPSVAPPTVSTTQRVAIAGRWTSYWLLAAVISPVINLSVGFGVLRSLGEAAFLLVFPLLIAAESAALRWLVHRGAAGPHRLGGIATAGLVFAATNVWAGVLFLIALSQPHAFTF
ncbi:MAG: hypothetical protein JO244_08025 [Solirubrobacterales bacterium]|nr:hypothetical protein [Solirubrobacterales bacterium]